MRALLAAALLLAALPAAAGGLRHEATVTLDREAGRVAVVDTIHLDGGGILAYDLAEGFTVDKAIVDGEAWEAVRQAVPLRGKGPHSVELHYGGPLQPLAGARGGPGGADRPVIGDGGAYLPAGSGWLPMTDRGPFDYRVTVRVKEPWKAVMPGRLVEEATADGSYRAVYESETVQDAVPLMAGPWAVEERHHAGIRLRTWFDPALKGEAADYLDLTAGYLDLYEDWIGPYPFSAFHIVSAPVPVGLGYPNMTYIGSRVLRLPFIRHTSLGHEILHNWWGNGVYVAYEEGNWAEGLTTFMADYTYALQDSPAQAREVRLKWLRDYAALPRERDRPVVDFVFKSHDAAQVVGYHKVAFFFHMLRRHIGAAAFDSGIRRLWRENTFKRASWTDLRRAFEKAAGRKLAPLFDQWLHRVGAPRLRMPEAAAADGAVRFTLAQVQDGEPYRLTLPVEVTTTTGRETFTAEMETARQTFRFEVAAPVVRLEVDPDFDVFRRLAPEEAPSIIRDVTLDPRTVVVAESEAARRLAGRMLDVEQDGGTPAPDRPVLIIGTAEKVAGWLADLGLPGPPDSIAGRGTARAWAGRDANGRSYVVVQAADAGALQAVQRPLPHYLRRGWVVFEGSQAVAKGNWEPEPGPLSVRFR